MDGIDIGKDTKEVEKERLVRRNTLYPNVSTCIQNVPKYPKELIQSVKYHIVYGIYFVEKCIHISPVCF